MEEDEVKTPILLATPNTSMSVRSHGIVINGSWMKDKDEMLTLFLSELEWDAQLQKMPHVLQEWLETHQINRLSVISFDDYTDMIVDRYTSSAHRIRLRDITLECKGYHATTDWFSIKELTSCVVTAVIDFNEWWENLAED